MQKIRVLVACLISIVPGNFLRVALYRFLMQYDISFSSKIGFLTIIAVDHVVIKNATIKELNRFIGPYTLEVNKGTIIGRNNEFYCGTWVLKNKQISKQYLRKCKIGKNCFITSFHFIDTAGGFELKQNSLIAGRQSQFWTHGTSKNDPSVVIGENCYIASAVRFTPGSGTGNNCIVGIGSIVTRRFQNNNALIVGSPAHIIKENYHWRKEWYWER